MSSENKITGIKTDGSGLRFVAGPESAGLRLDIYLTQQEKISDYSRAMAQHLIRSGHVLVNGRERKASYRIQCGDELTASLPSPKSSELVPEEVFFQVIYEDEDLVVLSKPPGLVVHPACGHSEGTLVHALLYHCDNLSGISGELRPGIVHRLDKDTSGIMVAAKNDYAHRSLVDQFKNREVDKTYHAILDGRPASSEGRIALPIARHQVNRKKMAIREVNGREAVTSWKILEELSCSFTFVQVKPQTGRTHQIRVHMASGGYPVAGDALYGKKNPLYSRLEIKRQCLHASTLSFTHPSANKRMSFTAPLWPDIENVLQVLRESKTF